MRKRIILTLFMIVCLVLGGCGSSSDSRELVADEDYGDTADYEDDASSDTEDTASEDYEEESETSTVEDSMDDTDTSPAEAEGIVAMIRRLDNSQVETQLITIDPNTGEQNVIANFPQQILSNSEILNPSSLEDSDFRYFLPSTLEAFAYGNLTNWFSDDFTKMAAVRVFLNRSQEQHAGWIDTNGGFFDVSEAVGLAHETDFSNPDPIKHDVIGFENGMFVFCEGDKYFQVPLDNITSSQVQEVDANDSKLLFRSQYLPSMVNDEIYPTDWSDESNCIADFSSSIDYKTHTQHIVESVFLNVETGEITKYIPDSERCNWNGVLSPDGSTIAFLSTPARDDGAVEIYTVPYAGGDPVRISLIPNEDVLLNIETITQNQLDMLHKYYRPAYRSSVACYLLDWR